MARRREIVTLPEPVLRERARVLTAVLLRREHRAASEARAGALVARARS